MTSRIFKVEDVALAARAMIEEIERYREVGKNAVLAERPQTIKQRMFGKTSLITTWDEYKKFYPGRAWDVENEYAAQYKFANRVLDLCNSVVAVDQQMAIDEEEYHQFGGFLH